METQTILYETLGPPLGGTATAADTSPPAPSSPEIEPYTVLRSHVSLSTIPYPAPETVAPDYFSLEVNEGGGKDAATPADPRPLPNTSEASSPAAERSLEGNWFRANSRFKSPMLRLHKEILDFCDFLAPTPEEKESRTAAIESVFDVIKYIWPNAEVEVFGSFKTGLYLPSSDIDVVILGSNVKSPQMGLYALSKALSQRGIAKKIQVIAKARVPIIKFVEKKSGVAFDLSFDVNNGPKAAEFIMDCVTKWPPLKPLCLILKVFLQQRELNEVYSGGIGSYALLSMLIAMLRNGKDRQASPEQNLGVLLVDFFDMYGCKLNTVDVGVSCNDETFFQKSSRGFSVEGRPSLISIEDPQAPDNDIGKNSFNYYQAKSAFAMAYSTLTNTKTIMSLGPKRSILGAIIRPDAVLLERKGGSTGKLKLKNLFPDAEEPVAQLLEDQQEIYCNWPLNDEDEEPLPRGNGELKSSEKKKRKATKENNGDLKSSEKKRKATKENNGELKSSEKKKRKASKENKSGKKVKGSSENGSVKDRSGKKQRWRHQRRGGGDGGSGSRGDHIYFAA